MIVDVQHIFKDYEQGKMAVQVLKDVSFSVERGEYVAIMGPSGSGKTTLMNLLGCLDRPTEGTYILDDKEVGKLSERQMSDLRLNKIGFVFQNYQLLPRETAQSNVALPLLYAGLGKRERMEKAKEALEKVGLSERVKFKPTQMSGGQNQRVAIARAIVNDPVLLLADEPTGALDSTSGEAVMDLFKQLNDEGMTIIMITHDSDIAAHAKRIIRIRDGQIVSDDEAQEQKEVSHEEA